MANDCPEGVRVLDVREIDGPPLPEVMAALTDLGPGDRLCLLVGFEPTPLYGVLDGWGFDHETNTDDETWRVTIEGR